MAFEIRKARQEEMADFKRVASTALLENETSFEAMRPEWTLCAFEDGKLATTMGSWPLTMRFSGIGVPVSGVTCVGTLPIYRRRGHLRKIMTQHFQNVHEAGEQPLAVLLAAWVAIYQRYGYAVVSHWNTYNIEPRYLQFSYPHKTEGTFRDLGDNEMDFRILIETYRKFRADRNGYLHRGKATWDYGNLASVPAGARLIKTLYEQAGEPAGYVIYYTQPQPSFPPAHHLFIRDLVWLNIDAYRAIWDHFSNMDLFSRLNWRRAPADDPLPHLLLEPRMLQSAMRDGLLARIIDVDKTLTSRGYQEEAELTFKVVNDELCPWNQGRWKLETATKESTVSRTNKKPQLVIPISTLAMLAFGHITATEAARMGRLEANDASTLPLWDRAMRTLYAPSCADNF